LRWVVEGIVAKLHQRIERAFQPPDLDVVARQRQLSVSELIHVSHDNRRGRMDKRSLTELLQRCASAHAVPGAAAGILREGTAVTASHGVETRFSPGSLTKSMVATVIARLAAGGSLTFDDPVAAHVPELHDSNWAEAATVRDLLANRSGLPLRDGLEFGFERDDDLSRLVADIPADAPPLDFWSYTNVGWCVLGRVIEGAAGLPWEDAMGVHLFATSGMGETAFAPSTARAYGPAGTTLVSTADDLLRFAALHLEDPSLAGLREVHAEISIYGWLDAWCLGWASFDWPGGAVYGWDGLINGQRSVLRLLPEQQSAVVLMTNSSNGRATYRSFFAEVMPALFGISFPALPLEPVPGAAGDLSRFAGVYAWPDRTVEVTATQDGLLINDAGSELEGLPLDGRSFVVDANDPDNPAVTFGAFDGAGCPQVLYMMLWGLPRVTA
jgi:CubicO group peptidase (beta-lactamase class C family)